VQHTAQNRFGEALEGLESGAGTIRRRRLQIWGALLIGLVGAVYILYATWQRGVEDQLQVVRQVAIEEGLSPLLVEAIVHVESSGNATAESRARAYGLMQLRLPTAGEVAGRPVTKQDLFDPRFNVQLGCRYLRKMMNRYGQDLRLALMAYNAGPGNVDRWRALDPDPAVILRDHAFRETRNYVVKIDRYMRAAR